MAETPFPSLVPPVNIYRGDTTTWPSYIFKDDAGSTIDLSGYAWSAMWRPEPDSATVVTLTVDTSQAASGQLTPSATTSQTQTMTATGVWDLQSTLAGIVRTWVYGAVRVQGDVTHA